MRIESMLQVQLSTSSKTQQQNSTHIFCPSMRESLAFVILSILVFCFTRGSNIYVTQNKNDPVSWLSHLAVLEIISRACHSNC